MALENILNEIKIHQKKLFHQLGQSIYYCGIHNLDECLFGFIKEKNYLFVSTDQNCLSQIEKSIIENLTILYNDSKLIENIVFKAINSEIKTLNDIQNNSNINEDFFDVILLITPDVYEIKVNILKYHTSELPTCSIYYDKNNSISSTSPTSYFLNKLKKRIEKSFNQ